MIDNETRPRVADARRVVLVTIARSGAPRPVPICFVASGAADETLVLHSPIDEKPKTSDNPLRLARVRDIQAQPDVAVLIDHWDEDWSRLWWIRLAGRASILLPDDPASEKERDTAVSALRAKYPQYASQELESRPVIRIVVDRITSWSSAASE